MHGSIRSAFTRIAALAVAGVAAISLAACGSTSGASNGSSSDSGSAASGKIEVVASINQWGSVAKDLGGDHVDVTNIMSNTNVEAHDYEPTSQDVAKFGSAKVAVVNGADYDPWASKAAKSTKATLIDAAETAGKKEGDNPHVWFSAAVRNSTADAITAAYQKADPSNKDDYEKLNKTWHEQEQKLEDAIKQASANESEPTPADIKAFQDALKGGSIKMLVFNTQEANATTDQITSAAKDANVPIIELTEQMPKQYSNLLEWMTALVGEFAKA